MNGSRFLTTFEQGDPRDKMLLGGKGANLCAMTQIGLNVPPGFGAIANAMKTDDALRRNFLSRVKMFFYAGASLAQPVWDSLFESAEREVGERIVMTCGFGMTESSPYGLFPTSPDIKAGELGLPTPGMECKLVPIEGKTE